MHLPLSLIPQEIIQQFHLLDISHHEKVYVKILKGMYGLNQYGKISWDQLREHILPFGYITTRHVPGLWNNSLHPILFTLVGDGIGVKYQKKRTQTSSQPLRPNTQLQHIWQEPHIVYLLSNRITLVALLPSLFQDTFPIPSNGLNIHYPHILNIHHMYWNDLPMVILLKHHFIKTPPLHSPIKISNGWKR